MENKKNKQPANTTTGALSPLYNGQAITSLGVIGQDTTLATNTVYTATLSAAHKLALPVKTTLDKTITNEIILFLDVQTPLVLNLGQTIATENSSDIRSVAEGKYIFRFLFDNNLNLWTGTAVKNAIEQSTLLLLVRFNGNYTDEAYSSLTLTANSADESFPKWLAGVYDNTLSLQGYYERYLSVSGDKSKLNLGTGDFTIAFWYYRQDSDTYILYADSNNFIKPGGFGGGVFSYNGDNPANNTWTYITFTRKDGVIRYFRNGVLLQDKAYTSTIDLSSVSKIFHETSVRAPRIQELIIKSEAMYISDFTPPSAPYVIE